MADLTNIQRVRILGWEGNDLHLQREDGSEFKLTNCYPTSMGEPLTNADGTIDVTMTFGFNDK